MLEEGLISPVCHPYIITSLKFLIIWYSDGILYEYYVSSADIVIQYNTIQWHRYVVLPDPVRAARGAHLRGRVGGRREGAQQEP